MGGGPPPNAPATIGAEPTPAAYPYISGSGAGGTTTADPPRDRQLQPAFTGVIAGIVTARAPAQPAAHRPARRHLEVSMAHSSGIELTAIRLSRDAGLGERREGVGSQGTTVLSARVRANHRGEIRSINGGLWGCEHVRSILRTADDSARPKHQHGPTGNLAPDSRGDWSGNDLSCLLNNVVDELSL